MRKAQAIYTYLGSMAATASLGLAGSAHAATADALNPTAPADYADGNTSTFKLGEYINSIGGRVIDILLILAGFAAVGYLVYSGILYITSAGDADKAKKARGRIINAVIGVIVIAAAYFLIQFAFNVGTSTGNTIQTSDGVGSF